MAVELSAQHAHTSGMRNAAALTEAATIMTVSAAFAATSLITDHTTSDIHVPPTQPEQTQSINHQNPAITNGNETVTATPSPWANPISELKVQTRTIYTQVVHCKPVFMILARKKSWV